MSEAITKRKRVENLLKAHEEKYQEIVQNVNSIILKMDPEGKVTFFNNFAQKFFDYTEKEILGRHVVGTIVPETESTGLDLGFMIKDIEINPEKYVNNENENMRRNGERVWVAWTNKAIRNGTDKVIEILCIGNDITEPRRMENELKDYEERFRRLFETAKDGLLLIDKETGSIVNVNPAIVKMLGFSSEEFIGKKLNDIGLLKDIKDFKETIRELIHAGFINYENVFAETKQGHLIDVDIYLVDRTKFIQCNVRDVTERKQAEDQIVRSLEERTVMLREIHHRVNNNLALIIGLLHHQAEAIADESVRAKFEETENRLFSMALIYDNLYSSANLAHIDFKEYLKTLVGRIAGTYKRNDVIISVDMESIVLDVNVGIPCGQIVNELVSNSLKHGFPEGRKGTISVGIRIGNEGNYVLFVEDNGIGLAPDVDFRKTSSLGLQLVNGLSRQISGKIELSREDGAGFRITFPGTPDSRETQNG
ncbi:MAG: PAS domain S-box protein [Dissulfurispiraceae bacterium]|jgi:PAS domain S-box-containing protein